MVDDISFTGWIDLCFRHHPEALRGTNKAVPVTVGPIRESCIPPPSVILISLLSVIAVRFPGLENSLVQWAPARLGHTKCWSSCYQKETELRFGAM